MGVRRRLSTILCFVLVVSSGAQLGSIGDRVAFGILLLFWFRSWTLIVFGCCNAFFLSLSCISYHVIMCIAFAYAFVSCIRAFSPLSVLHSGAPTSSSVPFYLFRVRVLNIFGLDRDLSCVLGLLLVDRLTRFVPFELRLMLQRLSEGPKRPHVCCSPTPLQFGPKTHLTLLHVLERSITIAWPKTVLNLEPPSSLYL